MWYQIQQAHVLIVVRQAFTQLGQNIKSLKRDQYMTTRRLIHLPASRCQANQSACRPYLSNETQQALVQKLPCVWLVFLSLSTWGWTARDQRNTMCEFFSWASLPFIAKFSYPDGDFLLKLREQLQCTHIQAIEYYCIIEAVEHGAYETLWSRCRLGCLQLEWDLF